MCAGRHSRGEGLAAGAAAALARGCDIPNWLQYCSTCAIAPAAGARAPSNGEGLRAAPAAGAAAATASSAVAGAFSGARFGAAPGAQPRNHAAACRKNRSCYLHTTVPTLFNPQQLSTALRLALWHALRQHNTGPRPSPVRPNHRSALEVSGSQTNLLTPLVPRAGRDHPFPIFARIVMGRRWCDASQSSDEVMVLNDVEPLSIQFVAVITEDRPAHIHFEFGLSRSLALWLSRSFALSLPTTPPPPSLALSRSFSLALTLSCHWRSNTRANS
jgi:hypothetical protein